MGERVGLSLQEAPGVAEDVSAAVLRLAKWIKNHLDVRHALPVVLRPEEVIATCGGCGFALFGWQPNGDGPVQIILAGGAADVFQNDGGWSRSEAIDLLLHTFLHEFAHYEQWRDGRKMTERGVNVRAANLLRKYHADAGGCDG